MNRPIFLSSFFSIHWKGSKFFTSPANWQSNPAGSKPTILAMPVCPATRPFQTSSVPMPSAQTSPTPVTTTRRFKFAILLLDSAAGLFLCLGVFLDVLVGVLDRGDLLGVFIGNLDAKRLFKGHNELDGIERVRSQVVHERSGGRHFAFVHPELFHDDLLDAFFGASHASSSALNFSQPLLRRANPISTASYD